MISKKELRQKLSIQIILTHSIILVVVLTIVGITFHIIQSAGLRPPTRQEEVEVWLRLFMLAVAISIGTGVLAVFTFAVNKMVIMRIQKLEDAAKEVAKGNFNIKVEVIGNDELSSLTQNFNKMVVQLKANEYLNKEFVRNISHEFKTPISSIRAYGELLEQLAITDNLDCQTVKEYSEIIIKESDRLAELSKSVLQLSLLDSTTITQKEDTFKPAQQIKDIFRLMQTKWSDKDLILDLELSDTIIKSNKQLVFLVWQNLISNAIKFSNNNGTITVRLEERGDKLYFSIQDNGIGIKASDLDKVFNLFFMTDYSRNSEGSGLGLPIVKKILDKIGGEIQIESQEKVGTKVVVRLTTSSN